jgi:hypothetical protein
MKDTIIIAISNEGEVLGYSWMNLNQSEDFSFKFQKSGILEKILAVSQKILEKVIDITNMIFPFTPLSVYIDQSLGFENFNITEGT